MSVPDTERPSSDLTVLPVPTPEVIGSEQRRRVGRPRRTEGPAVTREQILAEAIHALTAQGVAGLSLREVARRLGVSLPTLQQHFPTKDVLYRGCIDEILSNVPVVANSGLADSKDNAPPLLSNVIRFFIERTVGHPRATAALWNDDGPGCEDRLRYLYERAAPRADFARQNLKAGISVGVFRQIDPDVFIALVALGMSSIATAHYPLQRMFGMDLDREEDRARLVNALTDILLYGIVAPGARSSVGTVPRQVEDNHQAARRLNEISSQG